MPELLFEIGCEELPALACREAGAQLPELCRTLLGSEPDALFIGPRRLAVRIDDLPEGGEEEVRRGPAERIAFGDDGKPTKAAEGFARGAGVTVDALERRDGHVWARVPGQAISEVLPERLEQLVRGLAFTKSMRWRDDGFRFARPVRWLCAKRGRRRFASRSVSSSRAASRTAIAGRTRRRSRSSRRPGTRSGCEPPASSPTPKRAATRSSPRSTRSATGPTRAASWPRSCTWWRRRPCSRASSPSAFSSCPSRWS